MASWKGLKVIRLNDCKGYSGLLGSPAMTAQHVSCKEESTINFRQCNKQDLESPGGGPLTVHPSFRKCGTPLEDSPARNPHRELVALLQIRPAPERERKNSVPNFEERRASTYKAMWGHI